MMDTPTNNSIIGNGNDAPKFCVRRFAEARELWRDALANLPGASLYHSERWLAVLCRSYKLDLWVATVSESPSVRSACLLARTKTPLSRRFVALPFSDYCQPLAVDRAAMERLLSGLASDPRTQSGCEIRGISASAPWQVANCFAVFSVDMARTGNAIERSLGGEFRRKLARNLRQAKQAGVKIERGDGPDYVARFYRMLLETRRRLGVPPQSLRFFMLVREIFRTDNLIDIWLATADGCDSAGLILLKDHNRLYYKWSARGAVSAPGANHLLLWSVIEEYAGNALSLDLGRADVRNQGLMQFKKEMGGRAEPLPYSYFPKRPRHISSEVPSATRRALTQIWRHLPLSTTRAIGSALYGYLT
ncbi:MAG TPA: GNAT family N-acetyltransferase [Methylocella sp.]|nr:GNAT family N-acetyltransferase [Methylocella sp.]